MKKLELRFLAGAAAIAACGISSTALAAMHLTVSANHTSVQITGHDYPTNGSGVNVEASGVVNGHWYPIGGTVQSPIPNQHRLASPPCLTVCEKGEFVITYYQQYDPCVDSRGYKRVVAYTGNAANLIKGYATVECPIAQSPTAPGKDRKSPGRTETPH